MEGVSDVVNVLEEIHVILFHVKDNADFGIKAQKAVGVLAGLRQEIAGMADADIAVYGL